MTGGALPADQADQTDVKEPEMVARVAAREAPESWSWVEQVGDEVMMLMIMMIMMSGRCYLSQGPEVMWELRRLRRRGHH